MMRRVAPLAAAAAVLAGCGAQRAPDPGPGAWSQAVTRICAHALLFEHPHEAGTRSGALAVARDIRASTERRLAQIARLPAPSYRRDLVPRWLAAERRLAGAYARAYVLIFEVIEAARTPARRAQMPERLRRLVESPDRLRRQAALLGSALGVADCTGGDRRPVSA